MTDEETPENEAEDLPETEVDIDVPFHDLDPAEIVWFGNMYKYFDIARAKLMKSINYGMNEMRESGFFWPVIESKCRHIHPLRFGETVRVHAEILDYQHRLKIYYLARRVGDEERVARGHTVQVAVDLETEEMYLESPKVLFRKLGVPYPEDSEE